MTSQRCKSITLTRTTGDHAFPHRLEHALTGASKTPTYMQFISLDLAPV